jgi:hypothetical protein
MGARDHVDRVTDVPPGFSERLRVRQRWYFAIMGTCIVLIVLAWNVVRFFSTDMAIAMSLIAAPLPPIAVLVANWREDH